MSNVLIIFQANTEHTEQMALAIGVGAVEAEANIRLRRLAAPGAVDVAHKGYGKLHAADLLWANTLVIGLESPTQATEELDALLTPLNSLNSHELNGKQAWTFHPNNEITGTSQAQTLIESALQTAGIVVLPKGILSDGSEQDLISRLNGVGHFLAGKHL